ncbi:MogA/MoaB family molybdenum cofactor biosynthesis protein [Microbacterium imperiale]|uniref:Molybdenum cofactor biosynthesis protein n=1 Tax=Microbacterium imperiale TaxID=33884 RepID=A0A9W6HJF0_9MICO|nr:MogA/MoaB family molybdenum cofactor biosynthesis protein [Microbacterium imperiale]MBP2421804.1 molybdenum cofactor synthesis domain-containing protein [Microbacterium imperiale]MDS0199095.1 MogA/MoaB family molybdenum cofactor biosynthesis protein [Microbacterium imperiale]BFE39108.1 MogA/MoaB family molybdenum cofactor biosynthesis protein [Microbacterium imperiale]GLJ81099.1 molybdenum cofactor biosynthesis protein [Microbacterium imperiale]
MSHRAVVVTVSDRSARGERDDTAGPVAVEALRAAGFDCDDPTIVTDGAAVVARTLRDAIDAGARLIVTTGGTGVSPRDETPEGTAEVVERTLPGIPEELRRRGVAETPTAVLSRGIAGVAGSALIVNLPGSPRAVASGIGLIVEVAGHVIAQLEGRDHR